MREGRSMRGNRDTDEIFDPIGQHLFERREDQDEWKGYLGDRVIGLNEARALKDEEFESVDPLGFHPLALMRLERACTKLQEQQIQQYREVRRQATDTRILAKQASKQVNQASREAKVYVGVLCHSQI